MANPPVQRIGELQAALKTGFVERLPGREGVEYSPRFDRGKEDVRIEEFVTQHRQPSIAKPHADLRELAQPLTQGVLAIAGAAVPQRASVH